ncbi:MAG: Gfo/Idh/MocA family oxidoreductase [Cruoricaptor ignavus]|nr:Gfo/Idh/MocA family oxidoreductase [Cruoricaptor ignavus]
MTKFAILGFGFMGKKHFDIIEKNPHTTLVAIIDNNVENQNPDTEYYQCLDSFLEQKPEVDIVLIATPNVAHFAEAQQLLQNGYNVFLEKPYCLKKEETEILTQTAEKHKKNIFFSNQNRYSEISKFLKKIQEDGLLGEIYLLQTNLFWSRNANYYQPNSWKGKKDKDGGTLYTQFFHFIDLIMWIFGEIHITNVNAKTLKHKDIVEIEDTGNVVFGFENGNGIGVLNFSTAVYDKNFESSMTIIAEKGTVKIGGQYFDEIEYCNIKDFDLGTCNITKTSNADNLNEMISQISQKHNNFSNEGFSQSFSVVKKIEEIYNFN